MTLPARLRAAFERLSLVRLLVVLGGLLIAINIGSAVWDVYSDRERPGSGGPRAA